MVQQLPLLLYHLLQHQNPEWFCLSGAGVMPNMSNCQITRSTRFAQQLGIIKPNPNPTTNHNPKTLTLKK